MSDFSKILEKVPDWKAYYTVDELHERTMKLVNTYPKNVELIDLGKSGNGESIECLKIGKGKFNALIHGFPNSEEPYGGNLLDFFSQRLAEDDSFREEMNYTWYLIKCIDPDGARLNEGFQKGPLTPMNFTLNFYRTPEPLAGEFIFPYRFGPLDLNHPAPETKALMTLMDRIPFDLISSLHMMKWGSVTLQLPYPCPELYPPLQQVVKDFNLFLRKRLGLYGPLLAPGIQKAGYFTPARNYVMEWAEGKRDLEPINGCYIYEYGLLMNPHLLMMVPECCLWYDPRMLNDSPSDSKVWDLLQYEKETIREVNQFMLEVWNRTESHLTSSSPFKTMMDKVIGPIRNSRRSADIPLVTFDERIHGRTATIAEKLGMEGRPDLYRMFYLGGMIRAFDHQLKQGDTLELKAARKDVEIRLKEYHDFFNKKYELATHPIRNLVGVGLGAILHSAEYVKSKRLWYHS
jgi:hypothetical protein